MFSNILTKHWIQKTTENLNHKPIVEINLATQKENFDLFFYLYYEDQSTVGKLLAHQTFHFKHHHQNHLNVIHLDFNFSTSLIPKGSLVSFVIDIWDPNKQSGFVEFGSVTLTLNHQKLNYQIKSLQENKTPSNA